MASEAEILASLYVGRKFENYQEVIDLEQNLRQICFMPIVRQDSRTVAAHNLRVSVVFYTSMFFLLTLMSCVVLQLTGAKWVTEYEYQTVLLGCSHNGEHVSRGEGKRPKQKGLFKWMSFFCKSVS